MIIHKKKYFSYYKKQSYVLEMLRMWPESGEVMLQLPIGHTESGSIHRIALQDLKIPSLDAMTPFYYLRA